MHKFFANSLFVGKKIKILPHCHSTNQEAVELLSSDKPPEGMVIITENQISGKGQRGNKWESEPGQNLTFSVILYPKFLLIKDQFYLNMIISLGIADYLKKEFGSKVRVKWPNDIYVGDNKICGILIENSLKGTSIEHTTVGVGLNVNQELFSSDKATSMKEISLIKYDLAEVLDQVLQSIEKNYLKLRSGDLKGIQQEYLENLYWINETHLFDSNGIFSGVIVGVDEKGSLIVTSNGESSTYDIKEIRFIE